MVCASAGSSEFFMYCSDCGEAFHSFCIDAPLSSMSDMDKNYWRCVNCKFCIVCSVATEEECNGGRMVYCELCDNAFHMGCLNPVLTTVPVESVAWYCSDCVKCKICDLRTFFWGYSATECVNCLEKGLIAKNNEESVQLSNKIANNNEQASFPYNAFQTGYQAPKLVETAVIKRARLNHSKLLKRSQQSHSTAVQSAKTAEIDAIKSANILEKVMSLESLSRVQQVHNCAICHDVISTVNYLRCSQCKERSHYNCSNLSSISNWSNICDGDFICAKCDLRHSQNFSDQNGTNGMSYRILEAVSSIQRQRINIKQKATNFVLQSIISRMEDIWKDNFCILVSVIEWALKRLTWFEQDQINTNLEGIENKLKSIVLNQPVWIRNRAVRFIILWKRKGNNLLWIKKRENMMIGRDENNVPFPNKSIVRLAAMSASFLHSTAPEVNQVRLQNELLIAVETVKRLISDSFLEQASHKNLLTFMNDYNHGAKLIQVC
jgi:hypothetical protein